MFKRFFSRHKLAASYKSAFDGESGLLVLHHLLRQCNMFRNTYVPGAPEDTAFREGQRSIGLHILSILGYNEKDMLTLANESRNYLVGDKDD